MMGYRNKPHVAENMSRTVLTVYPRELDREPRAGDYVELLDTVGAASGRSYARGTVFHIVAETDAEPHGMADPYYSNFEVETPHGRSVWSSIRLMLAERSARLIPRPDGAVAMVMQS